MHDCVKTWILVAMNFCVDSLAFENIYLQVNKLAIITSITTQMFFSSAKNTKGSSKFRREEREVPMLKFPLLFGLCGTCFRSTTNFSQKKKSLALMSYTDDAIAICCIF